MHISSNEVSSQNQLTMGGVTYKLIYMLKLLNLSMRDKLQFHISIRPFTCVLLIRPYTYTQFFNQIRTVANRDRGTYSNIILNFKYQLYRKQRVMHINSNEISFQNQLTISGVTHKFIYILKPINFLQCGTSPTFLFQHYYFIFNNRCH